MSGYYNESSYYFLLVALRSIHACVNVKRCRVFFFVFSSSFFHFFLSFYNLRVVVPYGRTDGHRGLSKLLLHGTRENWNTPENSSLPSFFLHSISQPWIRERKNPHCLISRLSKCYLEFFHLQRHKNSKYQRNWISWSIWTLRDSYKNPRYIFFFLWAKCT